MKVSRILNILPGYVISSALSDLLKYVFVTTVFLSDSYVPQFDGLSGGFTSVLK